MQNAAVRPVEAHSWLAPAALIVLAVTVFRIVLLAFNRTDLFVDETQYWLWGQELAFGYYSKPPLIGWVIRASTELGGSDAAFWIRLPAPLLQGATAMILGAVAAPRFGYRVTVWVVATFVTLPMVTLGSLMISTDTVMAPFLALGLWAWLRSLDRGGSKGMAILAGIAVGLGFLAKYAAIYYLLCAALAALANPRARPGWRAASLGLTAFLITVSPNIVWNLRNGLSTLEHTLDNADWVRETGENPALNPAALAEFFVSQFAVFGPVLFAGLLWLGLRYRHQKPALQFMLLFSLPIVAIVCVQALLSHAYANWAAAAYIAGTIAVVPWLLERPVAWRIGSLAFQVSIAIVLPALTVAGTGLRLGENGPLLLERYLGRSEMSQRILAEARAAGVDTVVAKNRDILADLFYRTRDGDIRVFAQPVDGRAPNHYVLRHALPADVSGQVLFVTGDDAPDLPCTPERRGLIAPADGAFVHHRQRLFLVPAECLR
ncbi:ArnT family glycosyltransferase [Tropicimonas sp.]|uniref:ArnT family glycosyltransferase n=1 Tax=Tropicimonas sp. TaxID=2067044 RepID=UPI003A872E12